MPCLRARKVLRPPSVLPTTRCCLRNPGPNQNPIVFSCWGLTRHTLSPRRPPWGSSNRPERRPRLGPLSTSRLWGDLPIGVRDMYDGLLLFILHVRVPALCVAPPRPPACAERCVGGPEGSRPPRRRGRPLGGRRDVLNLSEPALQGAALDAPVTPLPSSASVKTARRHRGQDRRPPPARESE